MSWYVEELLLNRENIRSHGDVETSEFEDLLTVEMTLNKLIRDKVVTRKQNKKVELYIELRDKGSDIFHLVCKKISDCLGDRFTDEGYLLHMKQCYNLNDEQIETLRIYIRSHFQHKLLTRPFNKENFKTLC